jgi:hypothetical protein
MNNSLFRFALMGVCVGLVCGCQKKETPAADVAQEAESKLPAQEQVKPAPSKPAATPAAAAAQPAVAPTVANASVSSSDKEAYEAWFKKYHLDLSDPTMLDADPDGDGFTNREEFLGNTDPTDANSHPAYPPDPARFLRLKEYTEARLPITLESIQGDKARLKRNDDGKIETVKQGDTVRGLPLKVLHIETRQDIDKNGEHVDLSNVTLEDTGNKEKYVLTGNLPTKTSASSATLVTRDGKSQLKVHGNDVFTWPSEGGANFKVIDMSQDQVVLQQLDNKQMWTVPRP